MPHKELHFRESAREKILRGASELADAVRVTLGPKSKCVVLHLPEETVELRAGGLIVLDPGVRHDAEAVEESAFLLSISYATGD